MRADEVGFRSGAGVHCRLRKSIGEGQIGEPDSAVCGFEEQVGIGCEVGVEAQCGAADHDSDVVAVIGGGQFGGDQSAQPPQPGGRRAFPADLAVERVRHTHFDAGVEVVEGDQATGVGFLDGVWIGDSSERCQLDRLSDGQRVDHGADCGGQGSDAGFDQFNQAARHDRIADPLPVAMLLLESAVGDLLLDDVAQIQNVAAGQFPQAAGGLRIQRSAQSGRHQRGGLVGRQRLQIEPVELAGLPQFLCPSGNRFTVTHRDHHFRGGPLHDLMHNERRQVIEQMHIIDTHHHRGARGGGSQRLDHPADQLNGVGATRLRPGGESTQRKCPRRG